MSLVNLDIFYIIAKNSILVTLQVYFPNAPGEKKKKNYSMMLNFIRGSNYLQHVLTFDILDIYFNTKLCEFVFECVSNRNVL